MTITDGQRRRWRRVLMLCGIPLVVAGTVVSVKFFATEISADAAITAYDHRAFRESAEQTEPLFWWNFYEKWKAPYDKGVALGMAGDFEGSLEQLGEALRLHPEPGSPEFCMIYTNIVYVVEKQGDAFRHDGDRSSANEVYRQALQLIEEAPEGCFVDPEPRDPNTKEQLEQSVPRIEEKIDEDDGGGDGQEGGEGDDGGDGDEQQQDGDDGLTEQERQLQEREREAERQRQEQQGYGQEGDEDGNGGSGVDKPW